MGHIYIHHNEKASRLLRTGGAVAQSRSWMFNFFQIRIVQQSEKKNIYGASPKSYVWSYTKKSDNIIYQLNVNLIY
jgi:hypothetical protein